MASTDTKRKAMEIGAAMGRTYGSSSALKS